MGMRQRRRLREANTAASQPALLRGQGEADTEPETQPQGRKKKAKAPPEALRESAAPPPPNLREADEPPDEEAQEAAGTPSKECGTCRMFVADPYGGGGQCWGYGNFPTSEDWVCNAWALAPDWEEQDQMADALTPMAEATAEQVKCPTCDGEGKIRGGSVTCPECNGTGKVAASSLSECVRDIRVLRALLFPDGSLRESTVKGLSEKDYSTEKRVQMAKSGAAIPIKNDKGEVTGGGYPIQDKGDLEDAIRAIGRAGNPAEAKAHIIKRARALGASDLLPDDWKGSTKESASMEERIAALEAALRETQGLREAKPDHLNREFSPMTQVKNSHGQPGYEITLIREGKGNEVDDAWYSGDAIRELVESGRAEGMQAYANHPDLEEEEKRPERDVRHLIGQHTDVKLSEAAGKAMAKAIFVPVTTNESHPTYGWVNTLAEAAARNKGPQPLVGWSLYGLSAGDEGKRPDGSEGRIVNLIMPTSGDMVTNAGAGGEFARSVMMESARRLRRATTNREDEPMQIGAFRTQMAEALKKVREADSDEARTAALEEVGKLEAEAAKIDAPPKAPDSIEALMESAPQLVGPLREAVKAETATELAEAQKQIATLKEGLDKANTLLGGIADVQQIGEALREAGVEDEAELRHFAHQAKVAGLREAADIKAMVEAERGYQEAQQKALLDKLREAEGLPEVEGIYFRRPEPAADGGAAFLRESGIPVKDAA